MAIRRISRYAVFCLLLLTVISTTKSFAQDANGGSFLPFRYPHAESRAPADPANKTQAATQQGNQPAITPLSARRKLKFGLREAFATPGAYVGPAIGAFITERREVKAPGKTGEDKFADGLSRFARAYATRSSAELLGSGIYPILFKQDPRYYPSPRRGFGDRVLYAAGRTFVTSGDNGRSQANFSRLLGNLTSSGLANLYERNAVRRRDAFGRPVLFERRVGAGPTFESFGISTAVESVNHIVFDEFNLIGKLRKLIHK